MASNFNPLGWPCTTRLWNPILKELSVPGRYRHAGCGKFMVWNRPQDSFHREVEHGVKIQYLGFNQNLESYLTENVLTMWKRGELLGGAERHRRKVQRSGVWEIQGFGSPPSRAPHCPRHTWAFKTGIRRMFTEMNMEDSPGWGQKRRQCSSKKQNVFWSWKPRPGVEIWCGDRDTESCCL